MGILSHQAGAELMARQAHAAHKRIQARRDAIRHRMETRQRSPHLFPDPTEHAEHLACPGCRTTYSFGNTCPDCGVPLASESLAASVQPHDSTPGFRSRRHALLVGATLALVTWGAILVLLAMAALAIRI